MVFLLLFQIWLVESAVFPWPFKHTSTLELNMHLVVIISILLLQVDESIIHLWVSIA